MRLLKSQEESGPRSERTTLKSPPDLLQIALGRALHGSLGVGLHELFGKRSIQAFVSEWLEAFHDLADRGGAERNHVRVRVHEADPPAVLAHIRLITGQQHPFAIRASRPVQNLESVEMPASLHQSEAAEQRFRL